MQSDETLLLNIKRNILLTLEEITNPATRKISYSIDGQSVSWTEYQRLLMDQLKTINEQLQASAPFEIRSILP